MEKKQFVDVTFKVVEGEEEVQMEIPVLLDSTFCFASDESEEQFATLAGILVTDYLKNKKTTKEELTRNLNTLFTRAIEARIVIPLGI